MILRTQQSNLESLVSNLLLLTSFVRFFRSRNFANLESRDEESPAHWRTPQEMVLGCFLFNCVLMTQICLFYGALKGLILGKILSVWLAKCHWFCLCFIPISFTEVFFFASFYTYISEGKKKRSERDCFLTASSTPASMSKRHELLGTRL